MEKKGLLRKKFYLRRKKKYFSINVNFFNPLKDIVKKVNKNRIGYGKGFYDKFLNKFFKTRKKILSIGVAFSFQKHHKLPNNKKDFKLNYIINEKGIV